MESEEIELSLSLGNGKRTVAVKRPFFLDELNKHEEMEELNKHEGIDLSLSLGIKSVMEESPFFPEGELNRLVHGESVTHEADEGKNMLVEADGDSDQLNDMLDDLLHELVPGGYDLDMDMLIGIKEQFISFNSDFETFMNSSIFQGGSSSSSFAPEEEDADGIGDSEMEQFSESFNSVLETYMDTSIFQGDSSSSSFDPEEEDDDDDDDGIEDSEMDMGMEETIRKLPLAAAAA